MPNVADATRTSLGGSVGALRLAQAYRGRIRGGGARPPRPARPARLAGGPRSARGGCDRAGGMALLTEDEIAARLGGVPGWERQGSSIVAVVTRKDFRDALLFTGAVAYLAEQANHHPDVTIQWNKVTLTLSTHSAGGLTAADFDLAGKISALG